MQSLWEMKPHRMNKLASIPRISIIIAQNSLHELYYCRHLRTYIHSIRSIVESQPL